MITPLFGRDDEIRALQGCLSAARNGQGAALVVRGEPGIGKTALLETAVHDATGFTVLRSPGYEAESTIPYAALQRVGLALSADAESLSPRHRDALRVAWGIDDGAPPSQFLVGMAMLALFAEAGRRQPVLCVVDDAHWLDADSLSVLAFVGRRLQAESAVLLFASRDHDDVDTQFAGINGMQLGGLDDVSAARLLRREVVTTVDGYAATRIAAATGGNPLALIDLARDLTVRRLSSVSLELEPVPVGPRLEAHYLRQVRATSAAVQLWLLVAAAESTGHAGLIALAAKQLGLPPDCGFEAQSAGLVTVEEMVKFRHPLVRSAVYRAAPGAQRRRVHIELSLAAATLGLVELEVRNAAEGTVDVDTRVAARLEGVAARAAQRGGLFSQTRLLARAAELTPRGTERNGRLLAAAQAATEAGAAQLANELLDRVDDDALDETQRGRAIWARAFAGLFLADPGVIVGASAMMLDAAAHFRGHDAELEQRALFHAFEFILTTEHLSAGVTLDDLGNRLQAGSLTRDGLHATVLRALAALILRPYPEAVPLMQAALADLFSLDDAELLTFNFIGFIFSTALFDEQASERYLTRVASAARDAGALRCLDSVLWIRSLFELDRGDPSAARLFIEQVRELRRAIGYDAENVVNVALLVWSGAPPDDVRAIGDLIRAMGFAGVCTTMDVALAIRDLAQGNHADAYHRLAPHVHNRFIQVTDTLLAEFVEAAARSGHSEEARAAAARIALIAESSGTAWIAGLHQRCSALLADDDTAEAHHLSAIDHLSTSHTPCDLARAHLVYGEWLRRRKRRREARLHLRHALDIFERVDAPAMAERARTELAATGDKVGDRQLVGGVEMTPREATVARMAASGATNADIAATLFISTNTVDYHLRKVFGKLGITSRKQLHDRFEANPDHAYVGDAPRGGRTRGE